MKMALQFEGFCLCDQRSASARERCRLHGSIQPHPMFARMVSQQKIRSVQRMMGSCVQCPCLSLQGSRDAGLTKSSAGAGAKLGQIGSDFQPLRKTLSAKNLNGVHGQTQYCMGISSYSM